MTTKTGMRDYRFDLKANVPQRRDVDGDYFLIVKAADDVQLNFDDSGYVMTRQEADGLPVRSYAKVELLSAVDQVVIIALGYTGGAVTPVTGRAKFDGIVNASIDYPTQRSAHADVVVPANSPLEVLPNDPDRLSANVTLAEDAPGLVRIGDSAVDNTHGSKLWPEDTAECSGSAAVWVFNPNGVDITVNISTESAP